MTWHPKRAHPDIPGVPLTALGCLECPSHRLGVPWSCSPKDGGWLSLAATVTPQQPQSRGEPRAPWLGSGEPSTPSLGHQCSGGCTTSPCSPAQGRSVSLSPC